MPMVFHGLVLHIYMDFDGRSWISMVDHQKPCSPWSIMVSISPGRENINVLNHIFWFNAANIKATEEMKKQFNMIKSAESEVDFNNTLDYCTTTLATPVHY